MANYGYQYETSPRKIDPEYNKKRRNAKTNKKALIVNKKKSTQNVYKPKRKLKLEIKILTNIMFLFAILFAVIACQALAEQKYKEKENLLSKYNELYSKVNSEQEISEDIRSIVTGYGMQAKPATLINLQKTDYIESSNDVDEESEEESFLDKILNLIN